MSSIEIRSQLKQWKTGVPGLQGLLAWQLKRLGRPRASLSLLLCGDVESKRLNARYRGIKKATDILSFPAIEGRVRRGSSEYIGDLALNLPYAWRKRGRFADSFQAEVSFLLLHGVAHLLGYHHDDTRQEKAMDNLTSLAWPVAAAVANTLRITRTGTRA